MSEGELTPEQELRYFELLLDVDKIRAFIREHGPIADMQEGLELQRKYMDRCRQEALES